MPISTLRRTITSISRSKRRQIFRSRYFWRLAAQSHSSWPRNCGLCFDVGHCKKREAYASRDACSHSRLFMKTQIISPFLARTHTHLLRNNRALIVASMNASHLKISLYLQPSSLPLDPPDPRLRSERPLQHNFSGRHRVFHSTMPTLLVFLYLDS